MVGIAISGGDDCFAFFAPFFVVTGNVVGLTEISVVKEWMGYVENFFSNANIY